MQAECQLERKRDKEDDRGVQKSLPETIVVEELSIVHEPSEGRVNVRHSDLLEAHHERVDQRKNADQQEH